MTITLRTIPMEWSVGRPHYFCDRFAPNGWSFVLCNIFLTMFEMFANCMFHVLLQLLPVGGTKYGPAHCWSCHALLARVLEKQNQTRIFVHGASNCAEQELSNLLGGSWAEMELNSKGPASFLPLATTFALATQAVWHSVVALIS